jgi:hypothetical protein
MGLERKMAEQDAADLHAGPGRFGNGMSLDVSPHPRTWFLLLNAHGVQWFGGSKQTNSLDVRQPYWNPLRLSLVGMQHQGKMMRFGAFLGCSGDRIPLASVQNVQP